MAPRPRDFEGVLVGTERGCKRTRGEAAGAEAEADTATGAAPRIRCHALGALPALGTLRARSRDLDSLRATGR